MTNRFGQARKPKARQPAAEGPGRIRVKIQPGASADCLAGKTGEEWKLTVSAQPVEGRANRACIKFLARLLGVPRSSVSIVRGETSRHKIIEVRGLPRQEIESRLAAHASR